MCARSRGYERSRNCSRFFWKLDTIYANWAPQAHDRYYMVQQQSVRGRRVVIYGIVSALRGHISIRE